MTVYLAWFTFWPGGWNVASEDLLGVFASAASAKAACVAHELASARASPVFVEVEDGWESQPVKDGETEAWVSVRRVEVQP